MDAHGIPPAASGNALSGALRSARDRRGRGHSFEDSFARSRDDDGTERESPAASVRPLQSHAYSVRKDSRDGEFHVDVVV